MNILLSTMFVSRRRRANLLNFTAVTYLSLSDKMIPPVLSIAPSRNVRQDINSFRTSFNTFFGEF